MSNKRVVHESFLTSEGKRVKLTTVQKIPERKPISFHAVKKNPKKVKVNFHWDAEPDQIEKLIDDINKHKSEYKIQKGNRKTAFIEVNYEKADDVLIDERGLAETLLNALDQGAKDRTDSMIVKRTLPFDFPDSYGMIIMRKVERI